VKKDFTKSFALVAKSCEMSNAESCTFAAWHKTLSMGIREKTEEGLKELGEFCHTYHFGLGCTMLGYVHRYGAAGVTRDRARAVGLYRRACGLNDAEGCEALGGAYLNGLGVGRDLGSALGYYRRACKMHNRDSCAEEAFILARTGGQEAKRKARLKLAKLCHKYNGLGCAYLAFMYEAGWGGSPNPRHAYTLYGQSCNLREGKGCYRLGKLHEEGKIAARDLKTAITYYGRSCDLGHAKACVTLGDFLSRHNKHRLAKEAYSYACFREDRTGCYKLGLQLEDSLGFDYDPKGAREAYRFACSQGHSKACVRLRKVKKVQELDAVRVY